MAKTVLVADDSPIIRKALCKLFEVEEDYDICAEATNGKEAIDLALKCSPRPDNSRHVYADLERNAGRPGTEENNAPRPYHSIHPVRVYEQRNP